MCGVLRNSRARLKVIDLAQDDVYGYGRRCLETRQQSSLFCICSLLGLETCCARSETRVVAYTPFVTTRTQIRPDHRPLWNLILSCALAVFGTLRHAQTRQQD